MASIAGKPVFTIPHKTHQIFFSLPPNCCLIKSSPSSIVPFLCSSESRVNRDRTAALKASSSENSVPAVEEEGIPLGALKLPPNTDLARFESLLFQWGNSLCQGANLPLPAPLKVDKVPGGARLGFVTIGSNGQPEVLVHIDCLVFPGGDDFGPEFRALRYGPLKAQTPPGEPRIMRSLLEALKKCVEITTA